VTQAPNRGRHPRGCRPRRRLWGARNLVLPPVRGFTLEHTPADYRRVPSVRRGSTTSSINRLPVTRSCSIVTPKPLRGPMSVVV